jgi:hypothetical protein
MNQAFMTVVETIRSEKDQIDLINIIKKRSREGSIQVVTFSFTKILVIEGIQKPVTSTLDYRTTFITDFEYKQLIDACKKAHIDNYQTIRFSKALNEDQIIGFIRNNEQTLHEKVNGTCGINLMALELFRTFRNQFYVVKWQ